MSEKLRGVPIIKGKDRYRAGMFALNTLTSALNPDLFILDDGFQHWRLGRDKDILLIDATRPFGKGRMLPLGPLREPVDAINRADIIVVTRKNQAGSEDEEQGAHSRTKSLAEEIRQYNVRAPLFFAEHRPSNFVTAKGDILPLEWAKGKRSFGFCGISNHQSFKVTLTSTGIELAGFRQFRDHHRYGSGDIRSITADARMNEAGWIVTTEKDIMRLKGFELPENLAALAVEFFVEEGFYKEVFETLR
jgi:tetraacyldisaccharide 4'-kinase